MSITEAIESELYSVFLNVDKASVTLRQVSGVRKSKKSQRAEELLTELHRLLEDDHQEYCDEMGLEV